MHFEVTILFDRASNTNHELSKKEFGYSVVLVVVVIAAAAVIDVLRKVDTQPGGCSRIVMIIIIIIIIIIIMIIPFKGAVRDFLQSPRCAANCLQHVRSSGQGTMV